MDILSVCASSNGWITTTTAKPIEASDEWRECIVTGCLFAMFHRYDNSLIGNEIILDDLCTLFLRLRHLFDSMFIIRCACACLRSLDQWKDRETKREAERRTGKNHSIFCSILIYWLWLSNLIAIRLHNLSFPALELLKNRDKPTEREREGGKVTA